MATSPRAAFLALVGLFLAAPPLPGQSRRPMTIVDLISLPSVSEPVLSPDARQLAFVRADADWKANRRTAHLWRLDIPTGRLTQLTFGDRGESSPRWSPDGRTLAFLARRGEKEETQVYLLPVDGGEASRLTTHRTSVSDIKWAPDGSGVYFRAADPKPPELEAREKAADDVYALDENYQHLHLWKVSRTGIERKLTSGNYSVVGYDVADDGARIAVQRAPTPLLADAERSELWLIGADGSGPRQLTRNSIGEQDAQLSPDGSRFIFTCGCNAALEPYYQTRIFSAPVAGGDAAPLFPGFRYEIDRARWASDGRHIYFLANMGVHNELFRGDVATGSVVQLTNGEHSLGGWFMAPSGQHVLTIDDPANAGDIWLLAPEGGTPRQLTHVFDTLTARYTLPRQEKVSWKGTDGVAVEGLLYYPLGYQAGKRYPLVVQTHGGPQASDRFGFGRWSTYTQVLAALGYAVLKPNYRGSTGYGDEFLRDMIGHYYQNAHLDVLAGVDYLVARGIADPERLVAMGWSAGGHMTDKLITFTDRFKAASAGAGASDWISMVAQSDVRSHRYNWFGGSPWQKDAPIDNYWKSSPLSEVWKVRTPTIFLVGAADARVPMPQSVEMFRGLMFNGVPTRLYVAPREPHGWQELRHELFKVNAELDWFEKYARDRTYTWERAPGEPAPANEPAAAAALPVGR